MNRPWIRLALVLVLFAATFLALTVGCYQRESATVDEPQHLVAGYIAWKLHDYRVAPEHPPLLRMWAALPLLVSRDIKLATDSPYWLKGDQWRFCREFFFQDNDADRLLFRARFMIALLGVLLGILVFSWALELFGFWPATIVLGLYCVEPNLVAHSGLVTTDLGAACFIFGAVYFAWRCARNLSLGNLVGLTVFFVLAQVSKYSALLLAPILLGLFFVRALSPTPWPAGKAKGITTRTSKTLAALLLISGLVLLSYGALWAVYDFRYAPTPAGVQQAEFVMTEGATHELPRLTGLMQWIDTHHLLPNACARGLASIAVNAEQRPAYLLGETSNRGWWYYFPLAFIIKTPIALLVMASIGLILSFAHWKQKWPDIIFIVAPPAVYFVTAMAGHLNIGLRHILPVYPFALLLAGWTISALLPGISVGTRTSWRSVALAGLCCMQLVEFAAVYPHCLAFFNFSIGGPRHGAEYLVDSNLDWGQDLKSLKQWMTEHQVHHINLCYFGVAAPSYYGIDYTPLPGSPYYDPKTVAKPELPGYVAVSATNLRGAYLSEFIKSLYAPLQNRKPAAVLGYSIYVYWVERPWW
ncbi:MAG TPA: glycosyltransferase family 39 protein [Verrucomicrobiae bacterium]|nr:glycosyltransferase family 39 protein [Verrucomicrobiae bacterium]